MAVDWAKLTDSGANVTRWVAWARIVTVTEPATYIFDCTSTLGTPRSEYICLAYRNATLGSYQRAGGSGTVATPPNVPDPPGSSGLIVGLLGHKGFVSFSSGTGTQRADVAASPHAYTMNARDIATSGSAPPHGTYSGVDDWEGVSVSVHPNGGATSFVDVTSAASGASTIPRTVTVPSGVAVGDLLILWMGYDTPIGNIDFVDDGTPGAITPPPGAVPIAKAQINATFGLR